MLTTLNIFSTILDNESKKSNKCKYWRNIQFDFNSFGKFLNFFNTSALDLKLQFVNLFQSMIFIKFPDQGICDKILK